MLPCMCIPLSVREGGACCGKSTPGILADRASRLAVVVCHPWGPLGGSMWDMNVGCLIDIFARAKVTTLRFDFRTGLDFGVGAAADLRAACDFLLNGPLVPSPPDKLLLIGYSFGALVVSEVAPTIDACSAFCLVAPPLGAAGALYGPRRERAFAALSSSTKPKLALLGTHDQFCKQSRFETWAEGLQQPAEARLMHGSMVTDACASGCEHSHARRIHHINVYEVAEQHLQPWVERTFGCSLEKLASSDGTAVGGGATDKC